MLLLCFSLSSPTSLRNPWVANSASWAIFGVALQWSQEETLVPKDEMTKAILQVVMQGV